MAHVLVIDDDVLVRETIRAILENSRHTVTEASDGLEALRLLTSSPVDLIVTDIMMPELDGIGLIRALRNRRPDLPILCISGGGRDAQMEYLPMAKSLGADRALAKPFKAMQLQAAVEELLRTRDPRRD